MNMLSNVHATGPNCAGNSVPKLFHNCAGNSEPKLFQNSQNKANTRHNFISGKNVAFSLLHCKSSWYTLNPVLLGVHCTVHLDQGWASVLFKRTERSLHSFPFFIKERNNL